MGVFITNWNPKKWTMPDEVIDEAIQTTADGDLWTGRWSLGSRRRGIVPGDVAVMFHQHHDRGLVASGTFTSEVYLDEHWDDPKKLAPYGDIDWDTWVSTDDRLPVETLFAETSVGWDQLRGSGVEVREPDATSLLDLWAAHIDTVTHAEHQDPNEVTGTFPEGATRTASINRYERDPRARHAAIERWGTACVVCGFDFGAVYGKVGKGYINVHHVVDLSLLGADYDVDPEKDLRPVCPNCHAMLHTERPAMTIKRLRSIVAAGGAP